MSWVIALGDIDPKTGMFIPTLYYGGSIGGVNDRRLHLVSDPGQAVGLASQENAQSLIAGDSRLAGAQVIHQGE